MRKGIWPASLEAIAAAEARIGRPLPDALKRVYLDEANGCIGPCYDLMGVEGGATDDLGQNIVTIYEAFARHDPDPEAPEWNWPEHLVPISHEGCAMYICIDCRDGRVIKFDPSYAPPFEECFIPLDMTFEQWLDGGWAQARHATKPSRS